MTSVHELLRAAATADLVQSVTVAAALGLAFHQVARVIDFEKFVFKYLAATSLTLLALPYVLAHAELGGMPQGQAVAWSLLLEAVFHASLLLSIGIYRLVFHRCAKFPGPLWSKITRWHSFYLHAKDGRFHNELARLHEEYGDFVRTGPREVTAFRASAVGILHGPGSPCQKSAVYDQVDTDSRNNSVHMTRDPALSRLRRKAWERGLSFKAIETYMPRLKAKLDLLMDKLSGSQGKSMNVTDWAMFYSFDIMGEVGFSTDFQSLQKGVEHEATKPLHESMGLAYNVGTTMPWLLCTILCIPGAAGAMEKFTKLCSQPLEAKRKVHEYGEYPNDLVSWLLKAIYEKDPAAPPTEKALNEDSRNLVVAGSDTTASTLTHCLYFLAKYPETQAKMQSLLDEALPSGYYGGGWAYDKVKEVKYLDCFIYEALRLKPALKVGASRQTPAQGIQIDEMYIPGETDVIVPMEFIQRDPRYWQRADVFLPERWGEMRKELKTDESPYMPFSLGAYSCPGKNLAMVNLRMSIAAILLTFDISFAPGEDGVSFDKDGLDTFVVTLPPLHLRFEPRVRR